MRFFYFILLFFPGLLCAQFNVSGIIWDAKTNNPISGVRISIEVNGKVKTDPELSEGQGAYSIDVISDYIGISARLIFQKEGYHTKTLSIRKLEVDPNLRSEDVVMIPESYTNLQNRVRVSGFVYNNDQPVQGVTIFSGDETYTTNSRGYYELIFDDRRIGNEIKIRANHPSYRSKPIAHILKNSANGNFDVDFHLKKRIPPTTKGLLIGTGGVTALGLVSKLAISRPTYNNTYVPSCGTGLCDEAAYDKANNWHHIAVVSLYTGIALALGTAATKIWEPKLKSEKKWEEAIAQKRRLKFTPNLGYYNSGGGMQLGLTVQF